MGDASGWAGQRCPDAHSSQYCNLPRVASTDYQYAALAMDVCLRSAGYQEALHFSRLCRLAAAGYA